ncbi:hypothetical protein ADUPG1_003893, partial [Aduncisulcus paluster]
YLGQVISDKGRTLSDAKIEALKEKKPPATKKEVRSIVSFSWSNYRTMPRLHF